MTKEELIRNLKYTMEKHQNDKVDTFGTNISLMCKDVLDYIEQQPCDDCVSRQAVLKGYIEIERADGVEVYSDRVIPKEYVEALPSVIPTQRWIPVSERLPNDREWVLGVFKEPDTGWMPLPFVCDYVGSETKATTKEYWILRGFTDRDKRIDYYFNLECVAWMPLPKSYKTEKRGNENG